MATSEGLDPSLATWMLEHGADPNLKSQWEALGRIRSASVMRSAMATNNLPVMRVLLAHGAVLESELFDPCLAPWFHVEYNTIPTLQFLLDYGLSPNVVIKAFNDRGTPLQLAIRRRMLDHARVLLLAGARQDVENSDGETPLEEAEKRGNEAMIELLQSNGTAPGQFDV